MSDLILEVIEGPDAGRQVELDRPMDIGRDPGVVVTLNDNLASRRHARISPTNGAATIEDLGSTNGTFLNGNPVHAPSALVAGDHIQVGVTVLEVRSHAQVAERPSAVRTIPPALATPARRPDYIPEEILPEPEVASEDGAGLEQLDRLLDVRTKARARTAPLAVFLLAVFAVIIFLATR